MDSTHWTISEKWKYRKGTYYMWKIKVQKNFWISKIEMYQRDRQTERERAKDRDRQIESARDRDR